MEMTCSINDIKKLEDEKLYTCYSNPMIDNLVDQIKNKAIKPISSMIWMYLKSKVNLKCPEWSIRISIRALKEIFGISKGSCLSALKELEGGGYINIQREIKDGHFLTNIISVRFPKKFMESMKASYSRKKPSAKKLSTGVGQNLDQGWVKKRDNIYTNNINTINNTVAVDNLNRKEDLIKKIDELNKKDKELLKDAYGKKHDEWRFNRSLIETLQSKLDNIIVNVQQCGSIDKHHVGKISKGEKGLNRDTKSTYRLLSPREVTKEEELILRARVKSLSEKGLVSDPISVFNQILYQVKNFDIGSSVIHGINICLKLVSDNKYRTPAGFNSTKGN